MIQYTLLFLECLGEINWSIKISAIPKTARKLAFSLCHDQLALQCNFENLTKQYLYNQVTRNADKSRSFNITGITLGIAKKLTVPDDYFVLSQSFQFQYYDLNNCQQQYLEASVCGTRLAFDLR